MPAKKQKKKRAPGAGPQQPACKYEDYPGEGLTAGKDDEGFYGFS